MRVRLLILLAYFGWSCKPSDLRTSGTLSTDSAGISIVISDSSLVAQSVVATVTPARDLDPRGPDSVLEFYQVEGLVAFDSAFGVINRSTGTLRVFDESGRYLRSIGGVGEGPGEFQSLGFAQSYRNDSILMRDRRTGRLTVFDTLGNPGRTFLLAIDEFGRSPRLITALPNGNLLAYAAPHIAALEEYGTTIDSSLFSLHDPEGEMVALLGRWPTGARMRHLREGRSTALVAPFAPTLAGTGRGNGFCVGFGVTFEIRCHDGVGQLRQILRVTLLGLPVTAALVDRYEEQQLSMRPSPYRAAFQRILDDITYPVTLPVYDRIVATVEGEIWVEGYRPFSEGPSVWWRLDDGGRFVGTAQFPARFDAYLFSNDVVRGVWRDELDVEYVRTFRVRW